VIVIEDVYKNFGQKEVLKGVNATIGEGEIFTIIGPSGQGKSTLLRIINLLDTPTSGSILLDGIDIHAEQGQRMEIRRRMGMVFQKPAVFNTTVEENIAYGLNFRHVDRRTIRERIEEALEVIGLSGYENRRAKTLSGGEMQRVALARSMVTEPDILILDEPTANLDPLATAKIEDLVGHYNREYGTTVLMSTHDMLQGQRLADRIGVMMHGMFAQTGTPREVFATPTDKEVARFIGIDNVFEGRIVGEEGGVATIETGGVFISAVTDLLVGKQVCVCIRPEDITLHLSHAKQISARNVFEGTIERMVGVGSLSRITVDCGIPLTVIITLRSSEELGLSEGDSVRISFKASAIHVVEDAGEAASSPPHRDAAPQIS
jgi:tungstate transport system ATP-binding protein